MEKEKEKEKKKRKSLNKQDKESSFSVTERKVTKYEHLIIKYQGKLASIKRKEFSINVVGADIQKLIASFLGRPAELSILTQLNKAWKQLMPNIIGIHYKRALDWLSYLISELEQITHPKLEQIIKNKRMRVELNKKIYTRSVPRNLQGYYSLKNYNKSVRDLLDMRIHLYFSLANTNKLYQELKDKSDEFQDEDYRLPLLLRESTTFRGSFPRTNKARKWMALGDMYDDT